jgi:hypothetical protein
MHAEVAASKQWHVAAVHEQYTRPCCPYVMLEAAQYSCYGSYEGCGACVSCISKALMHHSTKALPSTLQSTAVSQNFPLKSHGDTERRYAVALITILAHSCDSINGMTMILLSPAPCER